MKLKITLLLAFFMVCGIRPSFPQSSSELSLKVHELLEDFKGDIGIYVEHFPSGTIVKVNADTIFPTASIVKVPILLKIFDRIENGELHFHEALTYRDSIKYGGSGIMQFYRDSTQTDLRTLLALMLSYSDNTTSLWNQSLAGGGTEINLLMEKLGYKHTRVNSRTPGREEIWKHYGWGQTTPAEMAKIFKDLYYKKLFSTAASEQMFRLLSNTFYTDYAISAIPPGVNVASKQGMVNASRSEVFLVNSLGGDYVCAVFTKNNSDQQWTYDNEAWVLTRKLSKLLWNYFNPANLYSMPEGSVKYLDGLSY